MPIVMNQTDELPVDHSGLSDGEWSLWQLVTADPEQKHVGLALDYCLSVAARSRSADMANRRYFSHTSPDGVTPNQTCRIAACSIPGWYGEGNNIESIAAGYATPGAVWDAWKNSPAHRVHVLGEDDFFRGQTRCGIGYHYDLTTPYFHYWTIWFSHPVEVNAAGMAESAELQSCALAY